MLHGITSRIYDTLPHKHRLQVKKMRVVFVHANLMKPKTKISKAALFSLFTTFCYGRDEPNMGANGDGKEREA